jgi:hypothetical protein
VVRRESATSSPATSLKAEQSSISNNDGGGTVLERATLHSCTVSSNGGSGIFGLRATLVDTTVSGNEYHGIEVDRVCSVTLL